MFGKSEICATFGSFPYHGLGASAAFISSCGGGSMRKLFLLFSTLLFLLVACSDLSSEWANQNVRCCGDKYSNSIYKRGEMFRTGAGGTPQDFEMAFKFYQKAADRGIAKAQYRLGRAYSNGEGTKADYVKAVEFFRLAAEQGHAGGYYALGRSYDKGLGVEMDTARAIELYQIAADSGNAFAQYNLGRI